MRLTRRVTPSRIRSIEPFRRVSHTASPSRAVFDSFRRFWHRFRARHLLWQLGAVSCAGAGAVGLYLCLCAALHRLWRVGTDRLFLPTEDYALEEWAHVEPTLREGDVLLMMGTGPVSRRITFAQLAYAWLRPAAMRYSHVAVVVEAAPRERWPSAPGGRPRRGVCVLEAVDNEDVRCAGVDGAVRRGCAQVVEANRRLFGRDGGRWCYSRFAVRRLKGFDWTPPRRRRLRQFVSEIVGRRLDTNPLLVLAFVHPRVYLMCGGRQGDRTSAVSCAELIADLYKYCGVIQRRVWWEEVAATHAGEADVVCNHDGTCSRAHRYDTRESIQIAPCHFAEGMEVGVLDFAEGVSLGAEVRMTLPGMINAEGGEAE